MFGQPWVQKYKRLKKLGEGTYGVVYKGLPYIFVLYVVVAFTLLFQSREYGYKGNCRHQTNIFWWEWSRRSEHSNPRNCFIKISQSSQHHFIERNHLFQRKVVFSFSFFWQWFEEIFQQKQASNQAKRNYFHSAPNIIGDTSLSFQAYISSWSKTAKCFDWWENKMY